jgi:hypothetical protein
MFFNGNPHLPLIIYIFQIYNKKFEIILKFEILKSSKMKFIIVAVVIVLTIQCA